MITQQISLFILGILKGIGKLEQIPNYSRVNGLLDNGIALLTYMIDMRFCG
ncbi:MAG: hypothetical protein K9L79_13620 [Methylobacter tundripaludum]|nr:hypothetical protein [Methylobacter tundripaludum]